MVDIEAWVDFKNSIVGSIEHVACIVVGGIRIWQHWERPVWWWECEILLKVSVVTALALTFMDLSQERFIQVQQVLPVIDEGNDDDILLNSAITDDRVVDGDTLEVVVGCISCCDEL